MPLRDGRAPVSRLRGHLRRQLLAAGVVVVALLAAVGPARATEYRYWTYWSSTGGAWTFSPVGPGSALPADGSVQGWRFAQSTVRGQGAQPRIAADEAFDRFCGPGAAPSGMKRIAIVFDFGESSEAPPGQSPPQPRGTCAVVEQRATGSQVLTQAADVRTERGLVCAIGGYPSGECAPAVTEETAPSAPPRTRSQPDARDADSARSSSGSDSRPEPVASQEPGPIGTDTATEDSAASEGQESRDSSTDRSASTKSEPPLEPTSDQSAPSPMPSVVTSATDSAAPEFVAATAHTDDPDQPWWPAALTIAAVALIGSGLWWRRHAGR